MARPPKCSMWLASHLYVILALWPVPEAPGIHDLLEMHRCSVLGRLLITNYFDSVSGQCCGCNAITRIPSGLVPRSACKLKKKKVVFCVVSKPKSNTKTLSDQIKRRKDKPQALFVCQNSNRLSTAFLSHLTYVALWRWALHYLQHLSIRRSFHKWLHY